MKCSKSSPSALENVRMKLVIHSDDGDDHDYDDDEAVEGDDVDGDNGCYVYLSAHNTGGKCRDENCRPPAR